MRTRKQHIADVTTAKAVSSAKSGSWAATAVRLGFVPQMGVTLSAVARGVPSAVTPEGENLIRYKLGLPPPDTILRVPACPSCGGAHVLADCHGAPVAAVVALAPGESVRKPGKARARRRYLRPCLPVEPAARVERLRWLLGVAEAEARQAAPDATRDIGQTYTWQPGGWVTQYCEAEGDASIYQGVTP